MDGPQLNPLTAKLLGGADARVRLAAQLLAKADQTDDPSYARRLREVAEGARPLRTLLHDPAFLEAHGMTGSAESELDARLAQGRPTGSPEELRETYRAQLERAGTTIPSAEEAAALFDDVVALQRRAAEVVAEDRATGWGGSLERLGNSETGQEPPQ